MASDPPPSRLPPDVGEKFAANGSVLPFAGNTIIHHLSPSSPLQSPLRGLHAELQSISLAHLYALLPPSSWHMTLFEGICDTRRKPGFWPVDLPLDAPLDQCNAFFAQRLAGFDVGLHMPVRMAVRGFRDISVHGISLELAAVDERTERNLRGLRDRLAEATGKRRPDHDTYGFHLSAAYMLRYLNAEEEALIYAVLRRWRAQLPGVLEFGDPEFCDFQDMFAFRRLFYVGKEE